MRGRPRWVSHHQCTACANRLSNRQRMYSDGVCPYCGFTIEGTICSTLKVASRVSEAWTITKLKWVRALLKPILRFHIWLELRRRGQ